MTAFVPLESVICMAAVVCVTGLYYWGHCCIISVSGDAPRVLGYVYICNSGRANNHTDPELELLPKVDCSQKARGPSAMTCLVNCNTEIFRRCFEMLMKAEKRLTLLRFLLYKGVIVLISKSCPSSEIGGLWFISNKITFLVWFIDELKEQFKRGVQKVALE